MKSIVDSNIVAKRIFVIRGQKVMLSTHLAELYGVPVKVLIQAVKRKKERFPNDFMFQLTPKEFINLKSQFVTSSWGGLRRAHPYAFTEQGVAMLSSVLNSERAIRVNIAIMRAFVKFKEVLFAHKELSHKLEELQQRVGRHDKEIRMIFEAIRRLMREEEKPKTPMGFQPTR